MPDNQYSTNMSTKTQDSATQKDLRKKGTRRTSKRQNVSCQFIIFMLFLVYLLLKLFKQKINFIYIYITINLILKTTSIHKD